MSNIWNSVNEGKIQEIQSYVNQRLIDVKLQNPNTGDTLLHHAAAYGQNEIVNFLVSKGAIPNQPNARGYLPIHEAVLNKQPACVKSLIKLAPTTINSKDLEGWTPTHLACLVDSIEILSLLVENDLATVDINAQNNDGQTPLHVACTRVNLELVCYLLENGADISVVDNQRRPPLSIIPIYDIVDDIESTESRVKQLGSDMIEVYSLLNSKSANSNNNDSIQLKSTDSERLFPCHQSILQIRAPSLLDKRKTMNSNDMDVDSATQQQQNNNNENEQSNNNNVIELPEATETDVSHIIEWIYTANVKSIFPNSTNLESNMNNCFSLFSLAQRFKLNSLANLCAAILQHDFFAAVSQIPLETLVSLAKESFQKSNQSENTQLNHFRQFIAISLLRAGKGYGVFTQEQIEEIVRKFPILEGGEGKPTDIAIYLPLNLVSKMDTSLRTSQVSPSPLFEGNNAQKAQTLLKRLLGLKQSVWFMEEINQAWAAKWQIPHYFDMIKKPMDIPTIQRKIAGHAYTTIQEWADDINLMCDNCVRFNGEVNEPGMAAVFTRKEFNKWIKAAAFELTTKKVNSAKIKPLPNSTAAKLKLGGMPQPKKMGAVSTVVVPPLSLTGLGTATTSNVDRKALAQQLTLLTARQLRDCLEVLAPGRADSESEIDVDLQTLDEQTITRLNTFVQNCIA